MQPSYPQDALRPAACPQCENFPLEDLGTELLCSACGSRFQVSCNVPILIPGVICTPRPTPSDEFIRKISAALQLPVAPEFGDRIRRVFSASWTIPSLGLHTESTQFLDRLRSSGSDVPALDPPAAGNVAKPTDSSKAATVVGEMPCCRWLLHYISPVLAAATRATWNVRFANIGSTSISSPAVHLSYYWRAADGSVIDGLLTRLPVEIGAGREITLPMLIETPSGPGRYSLSIGLSVQSGEFVLLRTLPIEVAEATTVRCAGWNQRGTVFDYDADHLDAIELTYDRIQSLGLKRPRILEIGGNASPMIRDFRGELYNVDIDVHAMQMGYLIDRESDGSIRFYAANANALPFPDGFFDVILIFSSLHHMPDPRVSLRHYGRKLKADGLMGVLCEPVGHYLGDDIDPELLQELQKGLNEQTFSLEEWASIFQGAGLYEREVIVDRGSLKAFLGRYF